MSTYKKIFIFATILALIALLIGMATFISCQSMTPVDDLSDSDNLNITDNVNENSNMENGEIDFTPSNITSSEETTEIAENENTDTSPDPNGESFKGDWIWNGERIPNSDTDYADVPRRSSGGANNDDDSQILDHIDKQQYTDNAVAFLNGFLTYDPANLANRQYLASWQGYVSSDSLANNTGSGLLYQHAQPAWSANMSTYSEVTSSVWDIKVESLYVSHSGDDAEQIVARCSCMVRRNDALPGEIANWKDIHTYKESWAIAFDGNAKIVNATQQTATATDNDPDWATSGGRDY